MVLTERLPDLSPCAFQMNAAKCSRPSITCLTSDNLRQGTGALGVRDHPGQECLPERCSRPPSQLWTASPSVCANTSGSGSMTVGDRASPCRVQLDVRTCFVPLLRWLLAWWKSRQVGLGYRPDDAWRPNTPDRHKRGLPQLRHPCCLAHSARQQARRMASPIVKSAGVAVFGGPSDHAGAGDVRPRPEESEDCGSRYALWDGIHMRDSRSTPYSVPDAGTRLPARALVPGPGHAYIGYGTAVQSTHQTPSWNDDRGLGDRPGRAMYRDGSKLQPR